MSAKRKAVCMDCGAILNRDETGLSKKLISPDGTSLYCFSCMAELIGCTTDDLREKVEEFKQEGCTLFQ